MKISWCDVNIEKRPTTSDLKLGYGKPALEKAAELVDYVKEKMLTSMAESLFRKKYLLVY